MAKIPVATLTDNCWKKCPGFEIKIEKFYSGNGVCFRTCTCENLDICAYGSTECKKEDDNASE